MRSTSRRRRRCGWSGGNGSALAGRGHVTAGRLRRPRRTRPAGTWSSTGRARSSPWTPRRCRCWSVRPCSASPSRPPLARPGLLHAFPGRVPDHAGLGEVGGHRGAAARCDDAAADAGRLGPGHGLAPIPASRRPWWPSWPATRSRGCRSSPSRPSPPTTGPEHPVRRRDGPGRVLPGDPGSRALLRAAARPSCQDPPAASEDPRPLV
jgi:hypothetical protein